MRTFSSIVRQVRRRWLKIELLPIGAILIIALAVRLWDIGGDLPYITHPDEPVNVHIFQAIFRSGDPNPHFFNYPSLFFYVNALAYVPFFLYGRLTGAFSTPADILGPTSLTMGVTYSPMPETILLGRLVSVAAGAGAVALVYIIGKRLTGRTVAGLVAALLLAVAGPMVEASRVITPDALTVFLTTASFLAALLLYQENKTWQYLVAGLSIGLTASTKYNGALIILVLLAAHFLRHGWRGIRERNLYLALLAAGVGFLIATPFALLDFQTFWRDFSYEAAHYRTGHAGMEGNALGWYLWYGWVTLGILPLFALLGAIFGFFSRSRAVILLSIFPIIYFAFISSYVVRNDRTFWPLIPFIVLLASALLVVLLDRSRSRQRRTGRPWLQAFVVTVIGINVIWLANGTVTAMVWRATPDSVSDARTWINDHIPAGSKIAIESYAPYISPTDYDVTGFGRMIDQGPEWYVENGYRYLVFSKRMFGRFYADPQQYGEQVDSYEEFFGRMRLVRTFQDSVNEIRIYEVQ